MRIALAIFVSLAFVCALQAQGRRDNAENPPPEVPAGPIFDAPLIALLDLIPAEAAGMVTLTDIVAARRQVEPLLDPSIEAKLKPLVPFGGLTLSLGFDVGQAMMLVDEPTDPIGFSVFAFAQIAGWGTPPVTPVIATGIAGKHEAIVATLKAKGLTERRVSGTRVWHIRDDNEIDILARSASPFGGALGMSQRFALDGDVLLFARSWPTMRDLLQPGRTLATDHDAMAILEASYAQDFGDLLSVVIVEEQPDGSLDPAVLLGPNAPTAAVEALRDELGLNRSAGLPRFGRYGIALWQDGFTTTGALVIPFASSNAAETARGRLKTFISETISMATRQPFDEIFPKDRSFETVSAKTRSVVVAAFTDEADSSAPVNMTTFLGNPQRRILNMVQTRDIDPLIGYRP